MGIENSQNWEDTLLKDLESPVARTKFLRVEGEPDFSSSLILLRGTEARRIAADLNLSADFTTLPAIRRTGNSTPWMQAFFLGFAGEAVTDAALQRARSIFFTTQSAIEEWLDLLFRLVAMRQRWTFLKTDFLREVGESRRVTRKKWFEPLFNLLKSCPGMPSSSLQSDIIEIICLRLKDADFPDDLLNEKIEPYLEQLIFNEYLNKPRSLPSLPDQVLWENLLTALLQALDKIPYSRRHLGLGRLGRLLKSPLTLTVERQRDESFLERVVDVITHRRPPEDNQSEIPIIKGREAFNLVIQGAGDLSMNEWNVAFYHDPDEHQKAKVFIPVDEPFADRIYNCLVVWQDNEEVSDSISQATEWISQKELGGSLHQDLSITELKFSRGEPFIKFPVEPPNHLKLHLLVKFALYGKLVIRQGEVVQPVEIIDQFLDLRHVFHLANINPTVPSISREVAEAPKLFLAMLGSWNNSHHDFWQQLDPILGYKPGKIAEIMGRVSPIVGSKDKKPDILQLEDLMQVAESMWKLREWYPELQQLFEGHKSQIDNLNSASKFLVSHFSELRSLLHHPRHLFGLLQETDVWLLEYALLRDRSLRHLACTSPIAVDLVDLGAPQVWIDFCLLLWGYQRKEDDRLFDVHQPGEFCWDTTQRHRLYIYLKRSAYSCTIVGIGNPNPDVPENDTLYLMAWGHLYGKPHPSIWECAEILKQAGAKYALVFDEGMDVFQFHIKDEFYLWNEESQEFQLSDDFSDFLEAEISCQLLEKWMPVPIAFNNNSPVTPNLLKRHGLRASLAFWQEGKVEISSSGMSS